MTNSTNGRMKEKIFNLSLFLVPILVIELFLRLITTDVGHTTRLLNKSWYVIPPIDIPTLQDSKITKEDNYVVYDKFLGWSLGEKGSRPPLYYSSKYKFRISKSDYDDNNFKKIDYADIITIGDSFTHGDEVIFEESWPYILGQKSKLSFVNYAVGGYGIDQAVLSYQNSKINSTYVLLGVISGDLERATRILYQGLYLGGKKSKPMFDFLENGEVNIINQPALKGEELFKEFKKREKSTFFRNEKIFHEKIIKKEFFDFSYIYRIIKMFWVRKKIIKSPIYLNNNDQKENFNYITKILKHFKKIASERKSIPIVVILDNGVSFLDRVNHPNPWEEFKNSLDEIGLKYIDRSTNNN